MRETRQHIDREAIETIRPLDYLSPASESPQPWWRRLVIDWLGSVGFVLLVGGLAMFILAMVGSWFGVRIL
jgi:hypothetical protein